MPAIEKINPVVMLSKTRQHKTYADYWDGDTIAVRELSLQSGKWVKYDVTRLTHSNLLELLKAFENRKPTEGESR